MKAADVDPGSTEQVELTTGEDTRQEFERAIRNRLNRASGQLSGVLRMLDDDRSVEDVVTQLAAVSRALDRAGFTMISHALKESVRVGDDRAREAQLEKLFLSLA